MSRSSSVNRPSKLRRCAAVSLTSLALTDTCPSGNGESGKRVVALANWAGRAAPVVRHGELVSKPKPERSIRLSYSALLRIKDDDQHVLLHAGTRPGAVTPPGGVFKYFEPAAWILDELGFRGDRWSDRGASMRADLRGVLPTRSMPEFTRWFDSRAYREDATECLHRELTEELAEVGFPELAEHVPALRFEHVRTVYEGPTSIPHPPGRQLRRFEVHDLVNTGQPAVRLRAKLLALAADSNVTTVVSATAQDIVYGRTGPALIAPHAEYLIGDHRTRPDIPPVR